ncbi:hypothetical protein AA0119_g4403 [Alternaria tenuissima]|uniref:Uncharacterized protein n=2 Tax=Alternaria sect. Alternaria TaxID=2499237 RepID=A0A4Q4RL71_9PLEO|nr:hypothetical protein AG0111_0g10958 [Alternaria gaisen]OWY48024.1 hypothetical protein AALT_g7678 [Alternaria alternata]RYN50330.1 hypothetical protein AA0114_g6216 [Alternaria tenuissima]RYO03644.1 hypothetical protein AA0119_g4403 [Alternaria tenuissima]RYO16359.1 hypothetical protein AA0121_g6347 [Alternaria tenuissima]
MGDSDRPVEIANYYFECQGGYLGNVNIKFANKNGENDGQNWTTLAFRLTGASHQSTGIQSLENINNHGAHGNMMNWLRGGEPFYFEYGAASAVFGFWAFGSPKTTGWYKLGGTKCYSLMFDGTAADVEMGEEKVH